MPSIGEVPLTTAIWHAADSIEVLKAKAAQGDLSAQFELGFIYDKGRGEVKDEVEAVKWYRKAADQGDASAQVNLGVMYLNGTGVPKDEVEGYKWMLLAGAQGDDFARGQYN